MSDTGDELPCDAARYRVQNSAGLRWVDGRAFFRGSFTTAIKSDEIMVEISLPPMGARTSRAFLEVGRRKGDCRGRDVVCG